MWLIVEGTMRQADESEETGNKIKTERSMEGCKYRTDDGGVGEAR